MEPGLLKLLTRRKKNYIQCPQFRTGPTLFSDFGPGTSQRKGELKMGGDIIKGGEPKKKKAAPKKAAKKKAAKK
jgi:hypothetical protein